MRLIVSSLWHSLYFLLYLVQRHGMSGCCCEIVALELHAMSRSDNFLVCTQPWVGILFLFTRFANLPELNETCHLGALIPLRVIVSAFFFRYLTIENFEVRKKDTNEVLVLRIIGLCIRKNEKFCMGYNCGQNIFMTLDSRNYDSPTQKNIYKIYIISGESH